uniref:IGFBP N-terminal domain-containing protein n=1 Tax=Sinocyclocheilus anshuiensis TaxID=1608454 RepID=A0A671KWN0_9TELE
MQVILFAATVLFMHDLAVAEPKTTCPSKCDVSKCPSPSCPSGYVPDHCSCCLVCSLGEGAPCGRQDDAPCGDGLECRFPAGKRLSKGVCQCKKTNRMCGSDGKTYGNVCKMRVAALKAQQRGLPEITQTHKGPCAPSSQSLITSTICMSCTCICMLIPVNTNNYLNPGESAKICIQDRNISVTLDV